LLILENMNLVLEEERKRIQILDNIDLQFEWGKMYALTGPNGSGKSSVARVIMGIMKPTKGRVILDGEDITSLGITERAEKGIGYAFQHPARFKGLRVVDLLEIAMKLSEKAECQCLRQIGLCPDQYLERELDNSLSGGEIKRIEIATLLAQDPKVRLFDEPEAGIDLWSFEQLVDILGSSHTSDSITIIISHQEKILEMVDEIIVMEGGKITMKGSREDIWPQIQESARCICRQTCSKEGEIYADCPR